MAQEQMACIAAFLLEAGANVTDEQSKIGYEFILNRFLTEIANQAEVRK